MAEKEDGFRIEKSVSVGNLLLAVTIIAGMFVNWQNLSVLSAQNAKDISAALTWIDKTEVRLRELENSRTEVRVTLSQIQTGLEEIKGELRKMTK